MKTILLPPLGLAYGVVACADVSSKWAPGGTETGDTSDTGSSCDPGSLNGCVNMDLEDVPYAFEGSIPGTADLEFADECGGTCFRCLYLDSTDHSAKIYFRVNNAEDQWTVATFWYVEDEPGSYLIQPSTTWTSVQSNGLFSDVTGYLVMEPITGAVSVVGLSACPEIEGDVVLVEDDRGDD